MSQLFCNSVVAFFACLVWVFLLQLGLPVEPRNLMSSFIGECENPLVVNAFEMFGFLEVSGCDLFSIPPKNNCNTVCWTITRISSKISYPNDLQKAPVLLCFQRFFFGKIHHGFPWPRCASPYVAEGLCSNDLGCGRLLPRRMISIANVAATGGRFMGLKAQENMLALKTQQVIMVAYVQSYAYRRPFFLGMLIAQGNLSSLFLSGCQGFDPEPFGTRWAWGLEPWLKKTISHA